MLRRSFCCPASQPGNGWPAFQTGVFVRPRQKPQQESLKPLKVISLRKVQPPQSLANRSLRQTLQAALCPPVNANQEMSSLRALRKRVRETDRMAQANSYGAQLEAADSLLEPSLSHPITFPLERRSRWAEPV